MVKIMIVDDEKDLREMINLMMMKEGYQTDMAKDGNEFLEKVDEFQPDLVTLDVMMPGLTTKEILTQISKKQHKPKIILLTVVKFSPEEKEQILGMSNVVDYVTKPFDVDALLSTVKKNLGS